MSKYEKKIMSVVESFFNSHVLGEDGNLKVINESEQKKANDAINKLVMEKIKDRWEKLEEADDSLNSIRDEIDFSELNAGDDSIGDVRVPHSGGEDIEDDMSDEEMPAFESFDFNNIFEDEDEEEGDELGDDGDENFSDLQSGMDDNDMGGDDLHSDPEIEDFGDDELSVSDEEGFSDEGEEFGDELEFDFDFDVDGALDGDEFGDEGDSEFSDEEISSSDDSEDFSDDFEGSDDLGDEDGDDFEDLDSEDEDK